MSAAPRTAIVAGAGIGGLAAAVALRRAGWTVRIYERADSPRELGFGVLLAPNALAALDELGVGGAIVRTRSSIGFEVRRLDGRVLRPFNTPPGVPMVVALRPELHGALLAAVAQDTLHLSSEIVRFEDTRTGVSIRTRDGRSDEAELLIGADGIHSNVRRQLHPDEAAARPSGYCALRGAVHGAARHLGALFGVLYLDAGVEAATIRAGQGDAIYWYFSLMANDLPAEVRTPRAALDRLASRLETPLRAILSATADEDMRFDVLLRRDPLPAWGRGRVTLLGDAAHPVLPHTGQGAAQALEDAVALGLSLSRDAALEPALRRYEQIRRARTNRFIKAGPRIARLTTTRNPLVQGLRSMALRCIPERLLAQSLDRLGKDPHQVLR